MLVFLNGQFVSAESATVSVFDRGFLYGDGLFETMRVCDGRPFRWAQHLERLRRGAEFLQIRLPFSADALGRFAAELIWKNRMPDALLRLTLSRGASARGYSPKGADRPTLVMSLSASPAPRGAALARWKLVLASVRLRANDPLSPFKTCNKLPQVLARAEADAAGADEALLRNTGGFVVEGAASNLFWVEDGAVCTPPLTSGILPGVTRAAVCDLCRSLGRPVRETNVKSPALKRAGEIFLTLSSRGVVSAESLDGMPLPEPVIARRLQAAYLALLRAETRA